MIKVRYRYVTAEVCQIKQGNERCLSLRMTSKEIKATKEKKNNMIAGLMQEGSGCCRGTGRRRLVSCHTSRVTLKGFFTVQQSFVVKLQLETENVAINLILVNSLENHHYHQPVFSQ
jgi:N-dimethylarginine dimethylaminohydrolase